MAAMFFFAGATNYADYLRDVEKQQHLERLPPGGFGRPVLIDYYFQNFMAYTLGGVIAVLIGLVLLMLNRGQRQVTSVRKP
jgi:hypothetical protein